MNTKTLTGALSGLLFMAGMATSAQAVTLQMTAGGASAGTPFATDVPLNLCDTHNTSGDPDMPQLFENGLLNSNTADTGITGQVTTGKILIWRCKRTVGVTTFDVIMRYSATGSSDGINRIKATFGTTGSTGSKMNYFRIFQNNDDVTAAPILTGCSSAVETTRPSDGKKYLRRTGCVGDGAGSPPTAAALDVHVGWSDVKGNTFGQTGPGTAVFVLPLDETGIEGQGVAVVPFGFVLGNGVVEVRADGKSRGPVQTLSRQQIESIFSDLVTDWRQLGLGVIAPCTGLDTPHAGCGRVNQDPAGQPDDANLGDPALNPPLRNGKPPAGVTLLTDAASNTLISCHRRSGSGTKAAFDATTMKDVTETPTGTSTLTNPNPPGGNFFGASNQDIRDCIGGNDAGAKPQHANAIGYMEADQASEVEFSLPPVATALMPRGYITRRDGYHFRDFNYSPTDNKKQKNDLFCGRYEYWVTERFNVRPGDASAVGNADLNALILAYRTNAADPATIAIVPAGQFWASPNDMNVTKVEDNGPLTWKALPLPTTCQFFNTTVTLP